MKAEFAKNISVAVLSRVNDIKLDIPSQNAQIEIDKLLKRSVLHGGKRLRPLLTYLFSELFQLNLGECDDAASAIEMVHAASLAHDDVIDEATMRRGIKSINIQASNKKAILAGDYLLAAVIGKLANSGNLALVRSMSDVIEKLAKGEWLQSDCVLSRDYSLDILEEISLLKTSSVMSFCTTAPAIIKNVNESYIRLTMQFGEHLGLAFQMLDDCFDFMEFQGESGKDKLLDLKNGQINFVLFEWLKQNDSINLQYRQGQDVTHYISDNKSNLHDAISIAQSRASEHISKCDLILDQIEKDLLSDNFSSREVKKSSKSIRFLLNYLAHRNQ